MGAILVCRGFLPMFAILTVGLLAQPAAGRSSVAPDSPSQDCAESTILFMPLRDTNRVHFGKDPSRHLEAQIGGDVALWGQDDVTNLACDENKKWAGQAYASAFVRLRMLTEKTSAPVAPPSFMPKFTYQLIGRGASNAVVVNFTFAHHSNGQSGCPFENQIRFDDKKCEFPDGSDPHPEINVDTGSFSTHYGRVGFHYYLTNGANLGLLLGVGGEQHLWSGRFGSLSKELRARYGPTRTDATLGVSLWRLTLRGALQHIHGDSVAFSPTSRTVEGFWYIRRLPNALAVHASYYNGRDYYNINFEQHIRRFVVGVTFGWQPAAPLGL